MKKIITLYNLASVDKLSQYVDGFIVGSSIFGTRLTKDFSLDEINELSNKASKLKKEVFLNANQMFTDKQLDKFIEALNKINLENIKGIVVADIGTYQRLANNNLVEKVIYNPETLLTNTFDFNYLAQYNTFGAYVAKEVTLEDIITIGNSRKHKMFMVGHGHLNMFYSKRQLLDNYSIYNESENTYHNKQNITIKEGRREDKKYPIFEDNAGSHVFRSYVFASYRYLDEISEVVDYFIIDTIFKDDTYGLEVAKLYDGETIDVNKIQQQYSEKWDEGFLFKKTFYKR